MLTWDPSESGDVRIRVRSRGIRMIRKGEDETEKKSDITDAISANIADLENVVRSASKLSDSVV
jgi:hypothetical protein